MRVGEFLVPIVATMLRDLIVVSYLQADERPVPMQIHDKRGVDHQAFQGNTANRAMRRSIFS